MKKVRIISGVYCRRISEGITERKTMEDPAFEVEDSEAERLVGLKVARYEDQVADLDTDTTPEPSIHDKAADTDKTLRPETASIPYNDSMKFDELKRIAREHGISKARLHKMRSKREVISAIDVAVEKASSRKEEAPQIGAANFV